MPDGRPYSGIMAVTVDSVRENLDRARAEIGSALGRSGAPAREVRIMAVTKTHPPEVVLSVLRAGIRIIGENRTSEGGRKVAAIGRKAAEWHMIGPLHRSEVRRAVRDFDWIDSIDRPALLPEIASRLASSESPGAEAVPGMLLEVNTSGEASKHGLDPDRSSLAEVLGRAGDLGLSIAGLFTVGPLTSDESESRRAFAALRELRDSLRASVCPTLTELSMGMSDDFHLAVIEGATIVRLGRYLLGDRG
ncbi:YggS family pyridoxal phosphate-dependent enzyme [Candidatus Fermentibacterales bacterium]|nr:YggS family pyridoxal phosphate-dependent enzyme [Candidatus Fermentibacterales bacterium]